MPQATGQFLTPLSAVLLFRRRRRPACCSKRRRRWRLLADLTYETSTGQVVTAPVGTVVDGASIPCVFWRVIGPPMGEYAEAAAIHDYLWQVAERWLRTKQPGDFRWANWVFRDAMKAEGVAWWRRWVMWAAVAANGWWVARRLRR